MSLLFALAAAAAAPAQTVVDAERAFARLAQERGQWTAFRATAAPNAVLFTPRPTPALAFLEGRKDPPRSVRWWPIEAWQSCDDKFGVTRGGGVWPDGRFTHFATVWRRQPDGGWKWVYDHGVDVAVRPPQPARVVVRRASCAGRPAPLRLPSEPGETAGSFYAPDRTLAWHWTLSAEGTHSARATVWTGSGWDRNGPGLAAQP